MRQNYDIFISGGGLSGLIAATSFGAIGCSVLCVDPAPPVTKATADRRSTAFMQPSRQVLMNSGLWDRLADFSAPLEIMRLADAGGEPGTIRYVADFAAAEVSDLPFGWNLPNRLLRRELLAHIDGSPNVTFAAGLGTKRILNRHSMAIVTLTDGSQIETPLVIAADGRNSPIRSMLDIGVKKWRYGQKALVFTASHPHPHNNVSIEIHRTGGPFTFVPLPDQNGAHHSAIVWMETGPKASALMALGDAEFEVAASQRSCEMLGQLHLIGRRSIWPIISQKALRLSAARTALIAEAAHVVPPIGAQGLNMSLGDISALVTQAQSGAELGNELMLDAFERKRMPQITARIAGIDMLNRAALISDPDLRALRLKALHALHTNKPIRRAAMHAGMGI